MPILNIMDIKCYIDEVIRPKIQGDGGEVQFLSQEGDEVFVLFQGECSKCQILDRCVDWIQSEIQRELQETVKIRFTRKKPFFWD